MNAKVVRLANELSKREATTTGTIKARRHAEERERLHHRLLMVWMDVSDDESDISDASASISYDDDPPVG